jgi:cytochrome c oxidase subunit IV
MKPWHLPSALLWALLALLALLALTTALAYQRLGALNTPIALAIATTKALVVAAIFMELRERRPLTIAFAAAGFFWLAILLWLAATDFLTRPDFPPRSPPSMSRTDHAIAVADRSDVASALDRFLRLGEL